MKLSNANRKTPVLLFDVMETLVEEPFFTVVPAFFGMSRQELLAAKHPTSWIEFEKGELTESEYLARFFRDRRDVDGVGLRQALSKSYKWLEGMEQLLSDLYAAGYEIHALSNYSVWYEMIEEKLQVSRFAKWSFVSCHTGYRKPDPCAYRHAVSTLGITPAECVFVDDRAENIEAARGLGIDAIRQIDASELRTQLVTRHLLP